MNKAKNLETILTLCIALIVFFLFFQIKLLLIIALFLGLIGMFSNYLSEKISWTWLKLAEILGFISSKIFLTTVFFVFLIPVAWLSKFFNKDRLQIKRKEQASSYYMDRKHEFTSKDFENPW